MPQAVGISCRAWPGMVTDHHVHTWPALSSPFLCWFMFVLSQTTMTPPFPFLWSFLRLPMGNLAHSPNYLCGFPSWISDVMQNPPCSAGEVMLESSAIDPLGESFMRRCQNFPYIIYLLILNWNGPKILSTTAPCCGKAQLPLEQMAKAPDLEHFLGWGIHFYGQPVSELSSSSQSISF